MKRVVVLACLLVGVMADEVWQITAGSQLGTRAIPSAALVSAGGLRFAVQRDTAGGDSWIELRLVTADGRRFVTAAPLHLATGERSARRTIGFEAGSWAGEDGPLGSDALQVMAAVEVLVHGAADLVSATITVSPGTLAAANFTVVALDTGLIEVGPWREWRIRLAGGQRSERGEVDVVDASARRWPMFLDQPGLPDSAGRWRAVGPARWTLRLAPSEVPVAPCRVMWKDGTYTWTSGTCDPPQVVERQESLAASGSGVLPLPRSASWNAEAYQRDGQDWVRIGQRTLPEALAPIICWRQGWTGFRGPEAVAWPEAAELDRAVAAGVAAVDLLSDGLAQEQGPFRFGLSPWSGSAGPWRQVRDIWREDRPWDVWNRHVRQIVARTRAAPGLTTWTISVQRMANDDDQRQRLQRVISAIAEQVAAIDRRPLLARHPQLAEFSRHDPTGVWFDFEGGASGWRLGPIPLVGPAMVAPQVGSDGGRCLIAPLPPGEAVRCIGLEVPLDENLFNLDRLEFDASLIGGGDATLFAWITDHHHRWWQQRLDLISGDGAWQTVGVDFSTSAPWTCSDGVVAWSDDVRRRIRALGVVAYVRSAQPKAQVRIDRLRRFGWPRQSLPALAITALQPGRGQLSHWQPIAAEFQLSRTAKNPYDPDEADVIAEIEGPGGVKRVHPAYWYEPYQLLFDGQDERTQASGQGSWRWRWTPPTPGTWRWRIIAKVQVQGQWQRAEGAWNSVNVGSEPGGMMPIRVDAKDPTWFSKTDGTFWYPLGINLRSPGDARQDPNLLRHRAYRPIDEEPEAIRGWKSIDWERRGTRAFERWFTQMAAQHMNWARVWMSPWWCGLEWRKDWDDYGGLTWFSQANAARMDQVVELARAHGIYLQVELMNHGMVGTHADKQWKDSPYNAANGGPSSDVADWFRSDPVWALHQKRLRYTMARWGWSTGIAAWSLCSEMEFTGTFRQETSGRDSGHSPGVTAWVQRSLAWMRANEVLADRPTTIHFSHPWSDPQLWREPGLGFSNSNVYTAFQDFEPSLGGGQKGRRDLPLALEMYLGHLFPSAVLRRPTLLGEWGGHWSDNEPWVLYGELRTGLWLQACTPYGGNTGYWWWLWLDVANQWPAYGAISRFLAGEDPRGQTWTMFEPSIDGAGTRLCAQGMRADRSMRIYVWPRGYDQDHRHVSQDVSCEMIIAGVPEGSRWQLRRFDCTSGEEVAEVALTANPSGQLRFQVAGLTPDAAYKCVRLP